MSLILITGGSRSGKSKFAEEYCLKNSEKIAYIATARVFDDEMQDRVNLHKKRREVKKWDTIEIPVDILSYVERFKNYDYLLLDCLTMLVFNMMFDIETDYENITRDRRLEIENAILSKINEISEVLSKLDSNFIVVTNEIGLGVIPDNLLSRLYRDIVGKSNQIFAEKSKEVHFVISGIPMKIKG